ncbi:hypothetical protein BX661DRAFT_9127 [Kickxella alabastrina]|uniref:uncharacterized protein n=1 Tax=Kickxella alabastrina TaxID=61397 RepID=UPI00221F3DE3|nr:uncharacterized protein BX661DRAFT_9127 [Kickxella alabastrina]KAI7834972.1 hypothetical protein BX661DRAFT_9127 [Kickxella alabastrina]
MSCFSQLPFVVFDKILCKLINADETTLDKWTEYLPLLGVCHAWREAAKCLVYQNAILDGSARQNQGFVDHLSNKNAENKLANTNIGLIKATGNACFAKTLLVRIQYPPYYHSLVTEADSIFSFGSCDWSSISKIEIVGGMIPRIFLSHGLQSEVLQCSGHFHEQLITHMPHVSNFRLLSDQDGSVSAIFSPLLILYSHNLKHLWNYEPLLLKEPVYFSQLVSLDVDIRLTTHVPMINCQTLQKLKLRNIPRSFMWNELANTGPTDNFVFSNLHELSLDFVAGSYMEENKSTAKLYFPALRNLDIAVPTFRHFEHLLSFENYQWPNVTKLNIFMCELYKGDSNQISSIPIEHSNYLATQTKHHMPSITQMRLDYSSYKNNKVYFYNALANLYANQLTHVGFVYPMEFTAKQFSRELTHLTLNANNNTLSTLPRIYAESLKCLMLINLESTFTWDMFQDKLVTETINFKQLEEMVIKYNFAERDIAFEYVQFIRYQKNQNSTPLMLCPELKSLTIMDATINRLQRIICYGSNIWPKIQKLEVYLNEPNTSDIWYNDSTCEYMQATCVFANNLVKTLPHIDNIGIHSSDKCNAYMSKFCSIIFNSYVHQLKSYHCDVPIESTTNTFSPELSSLRINSNNINNVPLFTINRGNTECVKIEGDLSNLTWNSFTSNDSESNEIIFKNLRTFKLNHCNSGSTNKFTGQVGSNNATEQQPFTLKMPKLKYIDICDVNSKSNIFNSSIEFKRIDKAEIMGSYKSLKLMNSSSRGTIGDCDVMLTPDADMDMNDFYETTNSFFGDTNAIKYSVLDLNIDMSRFDAQVICWTNLHALEICQQVMFTSILDLLPKVPRLTKLILGKIRSDSAFELSLNQVHPISTNITQLKLNGAVTASSKDIKPNCIKYLILAITSLEQVIFLSEEFGQASFVKKFKALYPHLENITFE